MGGNSGAARGPGPARISLRRIGQAGMPKRERDMDWLGSGARRLFGAALLAAALAGCTTPKAPVAVTPPPPPVEALPAPPPAAPPPALPTAAQWTRLDPLTVQDADFARHRAAAQWKGLRVEETRFVENGFAWHFFRITNEANPGGYFWAVPHDDENAGFAAALAGVRTRGGIAMIVDTTPGEESRDNRMNVSIDGTRKVDPNRNFGADSPLFAQRFLDVPDLGSRFVLSLHTNEAGYDRSQSRCARPGDSGKGTISVHFCSSILQPFPSAKRAYPSDDDDTLVLLPVRMGTPFPKCSESLRAADVNVVVEQVWYSDGSLSNHLLRVHPRIRYATLETAHELPGDDGARRRLTTLADKTIEICG